MEAGRNDAFVRIAEWGWFGGEETHYSAGSTQPIGKGPDATLGVGWAVKSNKDKSGKTPSFRYIFAPPGSNPPNGWS